jgi:hypothetical protein
MGGLELEALAKQLNLEEYPKKKGTSSFYAVPEN